MDNKTLADLTKRIKSIDSGATVIDQKTTVQLSNTMTGIQNAFNRILTYSKNMNKIQQAKLEDTALYNKETQLEAPKAMQIAASAATSPDTSALLKIIPNLIKVIKKLDSEVDDLDLTQSTGSGITPTPSISFGAMAAGGLAAAGIGAAVAYAFSDDEEPPAPQPIPPVEVDTPHTVTTSPRVEQAVRKSQQQDEKLVKAATKAATVKAVPVRKEEPTKAVSKQGNDWTGKVSAFIGDTYRNVTSFMGGFLAKLASLGSQIGGFLSGGAQNFAGLFGFGGGPGFQQADLSGARGEWARDSSFIGGVNQLAQKWDIDAGDLLGLMQSESNLNPQARNPSGATGLIQFMPDTARAMGTSTDAIYRMNRTQQLQLVDQYFKMNKLPQGATAGQLYATVFLPAYNRKAENFIVARANGANDAGKVAPRWYSQNAGLDSNRDGAITVADLGQRLSKKRQEIGLGPSRAGSGFRALGNLAIGAVSSFGGAVYEAATSALQGIGNFISPLSAIRITSRFGPRSSPTRGASSQHMGVDFGPRNPGQSGDPVHAAAAGVVTKAGVGRGYGNVVYIDHGNGLETRYAHLMSFTTMQGRRVQKGEQVGRLGNTGVGTGPHLHFEFRRNGQPLDPLRFLGVSTTVRPDPRATEPGNEQSLQPGAKPVARPTSQLAQDAQTVAIDRRTRRAQGPAPRVAAAPGRGRGPIAAPRGRPPAPAKRSAMDQFLGYFGAG